VVHTKKKKKDERRGKVRAKSRPVLLERKRKKGEAPDDPPSQGTNSDGWPLPGGLSRKKDGPNLRSNRIKLRDRGKKKKDRRGRSVQQKKKKKKGRDPKLDGEGSTARREKKKKNLRVPERGRKRKKGGRNLPKTAKT